MSVLRSPGVPNSLVAGKNAGNFADSAAFCKIRLGNACKYNSVRENSLCGRAGNFFARAGNQFRVLDRSREFGQNRSALWRSTETYHPREHEEGRHDLVGQRSSRRSNRFPAHAVASPYPHGWIPEDGLGCVRKRRGGGLAFILAARAGGRPGRSWSRAPATDHPHPRGDPRRLRLGRRRGSPCLLRAPGQFRRRPCGRSSP